MLEPWAQALPPSLYLLIREGYLAVSMFFILSGFVLTRSYGDTVWTRASLKRYAVARFARVYPVYLLSLLILEPFIAGSTAPGKPWLIGNYLLLLQGWTGNIPVHWNTPAWSLSCEIFFYLCFPIFAVWLSRLSHKVAFAVAVAICFLPALLWIIGVPDSYKPLVHLADFAIGIVASRIHDSFSLHGRGYWLYVPGIGLALALLVNPFYFPGVLDLNGLLRPLIAVTLLGLAFEGGLLAKFLSARVCVYLGKASYSLYILHIPLLWTFKRWWPFWFPTMSQTVCAICYVAICVAISALVYKYVEEPANGYLRRRPERRKAARQLFDGNRDRGLGRLVSDL